MTASPAPSRSSAELLVTAEGDLDLSTAGCMAAVLDRACAQAPPLLVLDLASVGFVDCAALGPLLAARERMRDLGGDLVVRGASPRCRRLLVLTGLTELLDEAALPAAGSAADAG